MKTPTENAMPGHILIEALFAPSCGSRDDTLLMIDTLTRDQSVDQSVTIDFKETTISSIPEAKTAKFLGSPSIRINGKDIEPESIGKTDYGFG